MRYCYVNVIYKKSNFCFCIIPFQSRTGKHNSSILIQECSSLFPEVWIPLILLEKSCMMIGGLFLAWRTKHVTLPAMRDSACILISVLTTVFLSAFGLMMTSCLRHSPNAVAIINILVVTGLSVVCQNAVFFPKVRVCKILF